MDGRLSLTATETVSVIRLMARRADGTPLVGIGLTAEDVRHLQEGEGVLCAVREVGIEVLVFIVGTAEAGDVEQPRQRSPG